MTRRAGRRSKVERTPFITCGALREQAQSVPAASRKEVAKALGVPVWRLRRPLASKIVVTEPEAPAPIDPPVPPQMREEPQPRIPWVSKTEKRKAAWTHERRLAHGERMKLVWAIRHAQDQREITETLDAARAEKEQRLAEVAPEDATPVQKAQQRGIVAKRSRREQREAEMEDKVVAACEAMKPVLRRWPYSTVQRLHEETGCEPEVIKLGLTRLGIPIKRNERPGW